MSRKFDIFYILNYLNFSKIFSHLRFFFDLDAKKSGSRKQENLGKTIATYMSRE